MKNVYENFHIGKINFTYHKLYIRKLCTYKMCRLYDDIYYNDDHDDDYKENAPYFTVKM